MTPGRITRALLLEHQDRDAWVQEVRALLRSAPQQNESGRAQAIRKGYVLAADQLVQFQHGPLAPLRAYVPPSLRLMVMFSCHGVALSGHGGYASTLRRINDAYYWPAAKHDVRSFVKGCLPCQRRKTSRPIRRDLVQPDLSAGGPMYRLYGDITGPWPLTPEGNRYSFNLVCSFTRFPICIPIPNRQKATLRNAFWKHIICEHGCPAELVVDQEGGFMSEIFSDMCKSFDITLREHDSYSSWQSHRVERFQRYLGEQLSIALRTSESKTEWQDRLPAVVAAYRNSVCEATGYTPAELVYARQLRLPHALWRDGGPEPTTHQQYAETKMKEMKEVFAQVQATQRIMLLRHKALRDAGAKPVQFQKGDLVLVWCGTPAAVPMEQEQGDTTAAGYNTRVAVDTSAISPIPAKWQIYWRGPFRVEEQVSRTRYRCKALDAGGKELTVGHSKLVLFHPDANNPPPVLAPEPTLPQMPSREITVGTMVVIPWKNNPGEPFSVGLVTAIDKEQSRDLYTVHIYGCNQGFRPHGPLRPAWCDPTDGKRYYAATARKKTVAHTPYVERVLRPNIALAHFKLLGDCSLADDTLQAISDHPAVAWTIDGLHKSPSNNSRITAV